MPIREGDGTGIAAIREGDGTAISQVREGDGTVVYTAADAGGDIDTTSLQHRWPTDEGSGTTVNDSVGALDGTLNEPDWISGTGKGDFYLDYVSANDDRVNYGQVLPSDWTELTVSMWAEEINTAPDGNGWVAFQELDGSVTSGFLMRNDGTDSFDFRFDGVSGSTSVSGVPKWEMVTLSWNGTDASCYIGDGSSVDVTLSNVSMPNFSSTDTFGTGTRIDGSAGGTSFEGGIDDPKVYDRALTSSQVTDLFNNTKGYYGR